MENKLTYNWFKQEIMNSVSKEELFDIILESAPVAFNNISREYERLKFIQKFLKERKK